MKVQLSILVAALLVAVSPPAQASPFVLGSGTFSDILCSPACDGSFSGGSESGSISDTFAFSITSGMLLHAASATNSSAVAGEEIKSFDLELFSGTPTGSHSFLTAASGGTFSKTLQTTGSLEDALKAGTYFLLLTGIDQGVATDYGGSFSFAPIATPIEGAIPGLVLALGGVWWLTKRRRAA